MRIAIEAVMLFAMIFLAFHQSTKLLMLEFEIERLKSRNEYLTDLLQRFYEEESGGGN